MTAITINQITKVAEQQSIQAAVKALATYSAQTLAGKPEPVVAQTVELTGTWALGLSGIYTALAHATGTVQAEIRSTSRGTMSRDVFVFGPKGTVDRLLAVGTVAQAKALDHMAENFKQVDSKGMNGNDRFLLRRSFLVEYATQLDATAGEAWKVAGKGKDAKVAEVVAKVAEAQDAAKLARREARKAAAPAPAPAKKATSFKAPTTAKGKAVYAKRVAAQTKAPAKPRTRKAPAKA